jgi:hypothetical protein
VADQLADPKLALRGAGRLIAMMVTGHDQFEIAGVPLGLVPGIRAFIVN